MKSSICYLPYKPVALPEGMTPYFDAYVRNSQQATQYSIDFSTRYRWSETSGDSDYSAFVRRYYLELPDDLHASLLELDEVRSLPQASVSGVETCTKAVTALVQKGKIYSLETARVPSGEDFVYWFLTQSDTGYCVHFATSAALLLRYCGVPARYVTGYTVLPQKGSGRPLPRTMRTPGSNTMTERSGSCSIPRPPISPRIRRRPVRSRIPPSRSRKSRTKALYSRSRRNRIRRFQSRASEIPTCRRGQCLPIMRQRTQTRGKPCFSGCLASLPPLRCGLDTVFCGWRDAARSSREAISTVRRSCISGICGFVEAGRMRGSAGAGGARAEGEIQPAQADAAGACAAQGTLRCADARADAGKAPVETVFVPYDLCDLLTGAQCIDQIEICQGRAASRGCPWQIFNSHGGGRATLG